MEEEKKDTTSTGSEVTAASVPVKDKDKEEPMSGTRKLTPEEIERIKKKSFVYPEWEPAFKDDTTGVLYDFACGARICVPKELEKTYFIVLKDMDSDTVLFAGKMKPGDCIGCSKKYRIDYRIEIYDYENHDKLSVQEMDFKYKDVLVQMPIEGAVGDSIAWFSYIDRFQRETQATVHVLMPPFMQKLFEKQYPNLKFETKEEAEKLRPYAIYYIGLYFGGDVDWQPVDFRLLGLAEQSGVLLKVKEMGNQPPKVDLSAPREIQEHYVCIATQASSHSKHWNNPSGWRELIKELKLRGYRVLCIDKEREVGCDETWHCIPWGCEDYTGSIDLQKRIDLIHHCDFFIGLNSGLSWLAWCCQVPVVQIGGICLPWGEFNSPYYVQSRIACHGCWNDTRYAFKHDKFEWCPAHQDKEDRQRFECTKMVTPKMVLDVIDTIPGVLKRA